MFPTDSSPELCNRWKKVLYFFSRPNYGSGNRAFIWVSVSRLASVDLTWNIYATMLLLAQHWGKVIMIHARPLPREAAGTPRHTTTIPY